MLLTKTLKISPRGSTLKRYQSLGYQCQYGDVIEIKVEDLPRYSPVMVEVSCDYCGSIQSMRYADYRRSIEKIVPKYACPNCIQIERVEVSRLIYGTDYAFQSDKVKEKVKATNIERYGVSTTLAHKETQEKIKKTNLERYGTEYACGSKSVSDKRKVTTKKRYGAESPFAVPEFQEKSRKTIKDKYGVDNISQSEEIKEKRKGTVQKKYGVDYVVQAPSVYQKARNTMLDRYGVEYSAQSIELRSKQVETLCKNGNIHTSKQQVYLHNLYGGELNYPILMYSADILLDGIDIEYDGGGHNLQIKYGIVSEKEFLHNEIVRNIRIKQQGYKLMRIISHKDYLPSDEILLKMLSDARQYFEDYPNHSWIEYHIDEGVMCNAECKEGTNYIYGELRKISIKQNNDNLEG